MPFLYVAVLFLCHSVQCNSFAKQFFATPLQIYSTLLLCVAFRRISILAQIYSFPCPRCSMPLRHVSGPFPTILALICSARFCGYAFRVCSALVNALAFRFQTCPYCSCAYRLCTFPQQFKSLLLSAYALLSSAKPNISAAMHIISIPSRFKAYQCRHISMHRSSVSMLNVTLPSPNNAIPMRFKAYLFLRIANQCRYLKIVVGLWLISCQTKAPLPELRHCPNPLNFP